MEAVLEAEGGGELASALEALVMRDACVGKGEGDVVEDGKFGQEVEGLEDEADELFT